MGMEWVKKADKPVISRASEAFSEPDELPGCSTPRWCVCVDEMWFGLEDLAASDFSAA